MLLAMVLIGAQALEARWEVRSELGRCRLATAPGNATGSSLSFETRPLSPDVSITAAIAGRQPRREVPATIMFGSSGPTQSATYYPATDQPKKPAYIKTDWATLRRLAEHETFSISVNGAPSARFSTKNLSAGIDAMDRCRATILRTMRYVADAKTPEPAGGWEDGSGDWIRKEDFPTKLFDAQRNTAALIAWIVGKDGRIRNCTPLVPSGEPILDTAACEALTRRAKFAPPLDPSGKPTEIFGSRIIRYGS